MKFRTKSCLATLCLLGMLPVFAQAPEKDEQQFDKLSSRTTALETELAKLHKALDSLKNHLPNRPVRLAQNDKPSIYRTVSALPSQPKNKQTKQVAPTTPISAVDTTGSNEIASADRNTATHLTRRDLFRYIAEQSQYLPFDLDVPGQAFVSTGPYVGVPIQYSGSNLIVNSPSVNTDVQLLNIRKAIHDQLIAMGGEILREPYHSHLLLSGVVEGQADYVDVGGSSDRSDIDLTNVSFDLFFMGPSEWLLGFIEMSYDNGLPADNLYRVSNSRVFINKAFITIGDFEKTPFYASLGQFFVPFGTFSSVMVSDTLPKLLGRTKARAITVGYQHQGTNALYGSVYAFRGDSYSRAQNRINNGGINVGYRFREGKFGGNFGGGLIGNLADSGGMQLGNGFAFYEKLDHRVPAFNLRGLFNLGDHIDVIAEWVGATRHFSSEDMSYRGDGAKPWAMDTEISYSFYILNDRPTSVGIGYGKSSQALSLGIPYERYSAVVNTSLWRNTLQSLEFRHDRNYRSSATANGPVGAQATPGACTAAACVGSGRSDNALTASFDYYF